MTARESEGDRYLVRPGMGWRSSAVGLAKARCADPISGWFQQCSSRRLRKVCATPPTTLGGVEFAAGVS